MPRRRGGRGEDPRNRAYILGTLGQVASGYGSDVEVKDVRGKGFVADVARKDQRGDGDNERFVGVATSYNSMLSNNSSMHGRGYQYPVETEYPDIYGYPVDSRDPEAQQESDVAMGEPDVAMEQAGGLFNLYGQDREDIMVGKDTYNYSQPTIGGGLNDVANDVVQKAKQVEKNIASAIEMAFKKESAKHGQDGSGLHGRGLFKSITNAIKKAPQAFAKSVGVKPTDNVLQAFVKGLKSPLTYAEAFEKKTGISLADAAEKLGPLLAAAALAQPEFAPLLLPASAAVLAGGEGLRVLEGVDKKILKPAGF